MIAPGELLLLVSPKGKRYIHAYDPNKTLHTNDGCIQFSALAEAGYGDVARTHLGKPYRLMRPTLYDLVQNVKRQTQIIYPKDIGYIVLKLGVGPGVTVIEAGTGSGSLTMALAWYVGKEGRVHTYERRPEFFDLSRKNLEWAGLEDRVERHCHDIAEGFLQRRADALFLDVRTPWDYLHHAAEALTPGAPLGFLLPTVNQVSTLLRALQAGPFMDVEVLEIFLRRYKPVADRLRPDDRMVAHTGFLVFARRGVDRADPDAAEPDACHADEAGPVAACPSASTGAPPEEDDPADADSAWLDEE